MRESAVQLATQSAVEAPSFLTSQTTGTQVEAVPERFLRDRWNGNGTARLTDSVQSWVCALAKPGDPSINGSLQAVASTCTAGGVSAVSRHSTPMSALAMTLCSLHRSDLASGIPAPLGRTTGCLSGVMAWSYSLLFATPQSSTSDLRRSRSPMTSAASFYG